MRKIILPGIDEITEINLKIGGKVLKSGSLKFLITKVENKLPRGDFKKELSIIASLYWYDIITIHPFLDGNKRTATETLQLFLYKNGFKLETTTGGLVYTSLKIANNEITRSELAKWIYTKIREI